MSKSEIVFSGPLLPHAAGLRPWLAEQGYADTSQAGCERVFAALSRWLLVRRVEVATLTDRQLASFVADHAVADGHVPGLAPSFATCARPARSHPGLSRGRSIGRSRTSAVTWSSGVSWRRPRCSNAARWSAGSCPDWTTGRSR